MTCYVLVIFIHILYLTIFFNFDFPRGIVFHTLITLDRLET